MAAATKRMQGKAGRADFEKQKRGQWVYDGEVGAGARVFDVKVDTEKGMASTTAQFRCRPIDPR
ncbi:PepSY domain-containing protein [Bosea sp. 2RAB26]|uniref:PepSY domain-containing protein n=1 Tax=Bosea sp. 2RAB26 TaxID=3237476 RepID=UPI003F908537